MKRQTQSMFLLVAISATAVGLFGSGLPMAWADSSAATAQQGVDLFDGMRDGTLEEDRLANELGDLIYHWVCLSAELGYSPATLLDKSRRNIEARMAAANRRPDRATPS